MAHQTSSVKACIAFALAALYWGTARAAPKLADFAAPPAFEDVTISPKGDYMASKMHFSDGDGLVVIHLADKKVTSKIVLSHDQEVANYWWVSDSRLILEPAIRLELEQPMATGELIGIAADGSEQRYLFGFRAPSKTGSHLQHGTYASGYATVIDPLLTDPDHARIAVLDWSDTVDSGIARSYRINLDNGLLSDEVLAPSPGSIRFLADRNGEVRYAVDHGDNFETLHTFMRAPGEKKWQAVETSGKSTVLIPLAFSADNNKVYLLTNETTGRDCLAEQPLPAGERKILSCDDVADVRHVIFSFDGKEPIAVTYAAGKPKTVLIKPEHPDAVLLQKLMASFPDRVIEPVSTTTDGSKIVLRAYSDRDPGEYFLFDTKTMKAQSIAVAMDNIEPAEMGERRPISFKSRDGVELYGFLTIPPGKELKNLPLVVHPHGGPFDIADDWEWDRQSQMLATHGYAVLQINFRGSGGFGSDFVTAGAKGWDTVMIDDITDGVRWAATQSYADGKRLCIYGGSYGGYAAMMSAVREPDLYRCVIASSGLYDLNLMTKDNDFSDSRHGKAYIADFIGATPERLKAASPLTYIANLKSAVMIVHGKGDERAPFSQAEALRKALDARKYPYEWLVKVGEGHGFYAPENRIELYTQMLAFLDKNIGQATSVADTSAAGPATSKP